jgi:hypothetical protein
MQRNRFNGSGGHQFGLIGGNQRFGFIETIAALRLVPQCRIGLARTAAAALPRGVHHIAITQPVADTDEHRRAFRLELLLRTVIDDLCG